MKQEDKLRNTLREYYDNQEFSYNENEWEKAGAYLKAAKQKRRKRWVLFIGLPLFSLLTLGFLAFSGSDGIEKKLAVSAPESKTLSNPQPLISSNSEAKELSPEMNQAINSVGSKEKETFVNSAQKESEMLKDNKLPSISLSKKQSEIRKIKTIPSSKENEIHNDVAAIKAKENKDSGDLKGDLAYTNAGSNLNSTSSNVSGEQKNSRGEKENNNTNVPETTAVAEVKTGTEIPVTNEFKEENLKELVLQASEKSAVDNDKKELEKEHSITELQSIASTTPVTESAANLEPIDLIPDPSLNCFAGEGIFYEVGAAWLYGWKGPVHRDATGFSPVLGIHYMNRINNNYALSFGIQYFQVDNLANSSKTSRVSSYIYGEQSQVTVITPSTLYYLSAPLRVNYFPDNKNSFGAGVNLAYLLNVNATVTTYDEKPGSTGNYKTIKQSGYTQGFSWYDSQLALCYRRRVGVSFALQAEIFLGLKDVKQDDFFGYKNSERNSGARLSLIYYAFKKNSRK